MKTLGIKFQVAGVKEAQASLNGLKAGVDGALNQNKKAIASYQADVKRGWNAWKIDSEVRAVARRLNNRYLENFGTTAQKQNLTIRQERREFRERSTYGQLSVNNRALVLEFRLAYKEFFTRLEEVFEELKPDKPGVLGNIGNVLGGALKFSFDALLFPFQSALAGAFERMGEVQVQDFAEGFNKNFQRSLGLSFEETGGDVGNVIGKSLYKVYQKSIDSVDQYVKGTLKFNLADTLIDAFKYTVETLAKELPALALRTHRRIQINKSAIPEARKAAGLRMVEDDLPEATKADIEANKSITLVYGGANTDSADIGKDYVARVMKPYLKGSAVIPVARTWTNSAVDSGFQGDIKNLIKLILSNPITTESFKGFISENGLSKLGKTEQNELITGLDLGGEIDLSSIDRVAEILQSLIGNKDFALGKALQATFKGYNPDDVSGAAEAIALMEKFPNKPLQIGGFSHGGYNALGTVDLLNRMGYDQVKGFSIGTPITGANATINPDNFKSFMGDEDYYYKALTGLAGDKLDFPEFFDVGHKEGSMHSLQGYVRGDSVKGGLQEFLGDRVAIPSKDKYGKHDSAYGYAVGELGAETALVRTLLTYLGESQLGQVKAKEGFIFSAEETLPGYTGNLKKLGQNLKDEDTKAFHAQYIDFLETLQRELEIAEQLAAIGKQYKPIESLKKAAVIFPQMESLASKHTEQKLNQSQLSAAQAEAQEKEKYVFFQRKVKQQKDNIERTFQAMLGRKFTKSDENKGIYSFYNPEDYEARAGNFEGMVNWLENDILGGASQSEKTQAQPTLDLLKKITSSIRETGSTGQLDLETVRDAEKLLGIDLREFNALFKKFESEGKSKVDVGKYKDELRTFRRNRDQILTEKVLPAEVQKSLATADEKINAINVAPDVEKSISELQAAFADYLQEVIRKGTEYGTNVLRENAISIQAGSFNEAEVTTQFNELNSQFKKATKEYRTAVAEGNSELSTKLAEDLLFQSASLKRIYGQLVEQISNEDTAKSIRGFSGYLTGVQTEILQGQPNLRGRVAKGLPAQIAESPSLEANVREINFGSDIRAGVEKIINRETGEEIGYQFVLGINQGGQSAADINSPSRVWQWIGEMIKQGFQGGVAGIESGLAAALEAVGASTKSTMANVAETVSNTAAELQGGEGLLDPLLETEGANEAVNDFFGGLVTKVSEAFDSMVEKFPILGRVSEALMSIGGELLQVLGIFSLGESFVTFSQAALDAAMQMESLEKSIIAVSSSSAEGARNIAFVRNEARDLSIDLASAADNYKRLVGATRNTPLEGLQTEQLFSTLATTAKNRGLTTDATNRLFLGFEQVIGKNEFKSEEVKGQLAEVMGDIQNMLAQAVGVPISQLPDLMERGLLKAPDVMPKLKALMDAQNAALGNSSGTAASAQIRLNNAIFEYQDAVGRQLQPVQKMGLNSLANALEFLRQKAEVIAKLTSGLIVTVLTNLTIKLLATKVATFALVDVIARLGFSLGALLPKLAVFAAKFALMTIAIEVWSNNIKLARNAFPDLQADIEASTKALDALKRAFDDTGEAANQYGKNQPKQLQLNEGLKLPEWLQGVAGGERLNLDNLVRNRLNNLYDRPGGKFLQYGPLGFFKKGDSRGNFTTQAQNKQTDFVVGASDLIANADQTLKYGNQARSVLDDIAKIDEKARKLQSQRLSITPGDTAKLKEAMEAEAKVFKERDELLKKSAQYQESIQTQIEKIKPRLEELDELDKTGGSEEEIAQRKATRASLEDRLGLLEDEKKAIDEINSRIPKFLSELSRILQNTDLSVKGFIGNQEDNAVVNRTEAIKTALSEGLSDAQLQVKLDNLSAKDFEDRINFVNQKIVDLQSKLGSASVQEGLKLLEDAAQKSGLELTPNVLEKMLTEGRSAAENEAANTLLALNEYQGIVAQSQAGLVDLIKSNKSKLSEFSRTIEDYFFKINQQIKEATLETQRLISQIFYTDVKNSLRSVLAPGSNTFVNGIIDNVQSVLDQAQQVAEKVFGDQAAQLGFESETRTLATEMQDFVKQVNGASDALDEFAKKLSNGGSNSSSSNSSSSTTDTVTALRRAIIGKESGTNFKAVNPDSGALGYGQVMPVNVKSWTKEALGRSLTPDQFLNDSLAQVEVINYKLNQYLQKELSQGFDLDTAVRRVASTWYSGQPGKYNDTKAQSYNGGKYPSIDSYTKDILSRFKSEGGGIDNKTNISSLGSSKEGADVAKSALSWEGKYFKKGVYAMCAGFVRQVLKDAGVDVGVSENPYDAGKQPNNGELMARSFFGSDIGTVFKDKNQARAGDLVGFFDTYQYGQKPGAITHVGVYTGDGMMVDRSTNDAPVKHRSIDTYKGEKIFLRPHSYENAEKNIDTKVVIVNEQLVAAKAKNLDLSQKITEQEREALKISSANAIELNKRQTKQALQENARNVLGLESKFADFKNQSGYQSAQTEIEANLRNIKQQFLDADLDIASQITNTEDAINSITNSIPILTAEIARLKAIGTPEANLAASVQESALSELQNALPSLQGNLGKIKASQAQLPNLELEANYWAREQGKLKLEAEDIGKRSLILNQKDALAQARGGVEDRRRAKVELENARLEQEINNIRQNTPEGYDRNEQILNAQRQSKINKENIEFDAIAEELALEKKLLDYDSAIGSAKAGFLSRIGFNFGASKIQRDNAIAQENDRFISELLELEKSLKGQPDKLAEMKRAAQELNAVNLEAITQQFKSLRQTVEDSFISSTQGFFTQFTTNFFDGKTERDRAQLEERLRYAEEVVGLENQYREEPGKLAHLKNRARELNEQKLSNISQQFNIFGRAVNLAKQALLEFIKQMAQLAAQQAAAKFISSIIEVGSNAFGGGKNFDGVKLNKAPKKVKAFRADKGWTVGDEVNNYRTGGGIRKRKISDRLTEMLKQNAPGVAQAWNAEGEGAQLGVFHTGEELLSRKTGEAGRYQALKARYGFNPLEKLFGVKSQKSQRTFVCPHAVKSNEQKLLTLDSKLLTYSQGGTVGENILATMPRVSSPRIDLSGIDQVKSQKSKVKSVNIHTTVVTPNADSFKLNQDQMNQDLVERMRRGI